MRIYKLETNDGHNWIDLDHILDVRIVPNWPRESIIEIQYAFRDSPIEYRYDFWYDQPEVDRSKEVWEQEKIAMDRLMVVVEPLLEAWKGKEQ